MALGRVGGLLEAKKIAGMAEAHYAQIAPHLYCGPIEVAANIQIAACSPNFLILESIETWSGFHTEILMKPIRWEEGYVIPPTEPGLGVELNEAVAQLGTTVSPDVDDLLKNLSTIPEPLQTAIRNNGGGHSNHSLFWQVLAPKGTPPKGDFATALTSDLGGLDKFKADAGKAGAGLFGSGWVWLVLDGGKKLTLMTLPNQASPLIEGHYPLFGIDVWEHAYYLKYHNVRADYIAAVWNVVNWDFVSDRYAAAMKG